MLIAAFTFWVFVIIFSAWGTHTLLCRLTNKPRVVNTILLPGTLVAQLGHVLGLLITGNEVRSTALMSDDESGDPKSETPGQHKIPVLGSVLVGLLPIVACAACLFAAKAYLSEGVLPTVEQATVSQKLPTAPAEVWALLHNTIDVVRYSFDSVCRADPHAWMTYAFLYLAICLTIRMAPFEGHRRGAVIALASSGVLLALLGLIPQVPVDVWLQASWPVLSFSVALLLFLLMLSLALSGLVGLVKVLVRNQ